MFALTNNKEVLKNAIAEVIEKIVKEHPFGEVTYKDTADALDELRITFIAQSEGWL